jgi:hypothetical protein
MGQITERLREEVDAPAELTPVKAAS